MPYVSHAWHIKFFGLRIQSCFASNTTLYESNLNNIIYVILIFLISGNSEFCLKRCCISNVTVFLFCKHHFGTCKELCLYIYIYVFIDNKKYLRDTCVIYEESIYKRNRNSMYIKSKIITLTRYIKYAKNFI